MVLKESAEAVSTIADTMRSVPLAIALLVVNCAFLAFAAYVLGEVSANASERNKSQTELIALLATKCMPIEKGG